MFSRIREAGAWLLNTVFEPSEIEQIDLNQSRAVDGHDGGSYAPNNPIDVGGAGIRVLTPEHDDQVTPRGYVDGADGDLADDIAALTAVVAGKVPIGYARYSLSALNASSGDKLGLTERFATAGFVLDEENDEITVPGTGGYAFLVNGGYEWSGTGDVTAGVTVQRASDAVPLGQAQMRNHSNTSIAGSTVYFSGCDALEVDNVAKKITAKALVSSGTVTTTTQIHLTIIRLS